MHVIVMGDHSIKVKHLNKYNSGKYECTGFNDDTNTYFYATSYVVVLGKFD